MTANVNMLSPHGFTYETTGETVLQAALRRLRAWFATYPDLSVSFSGGKDSTTLLHLALTVAREFDRLPLRVRFFDDELLDPCTISYIEQVATWPEVDFIWYCVPVNHTIQSLTRDLWTTWDPDARADWPRTPPPQAVLDVPGWTPEIYAGKFGIAVLQEIVIQQEYPEALEKPLVLVGLRAEESMTRRRGVVYGGGLLQEKNHFVLAKPIIDWKTTDVWRYILESEVPYTEHYINLHRVGVPLAHQRIAPWGNASNREAALFSALYPDFFERAVRRMPELSAMERLVGSKLYPPYLEKPDAISWQTYTFMIIDTLRGEKRAWALNHLTNYVKRWQRHQTGPMTDEGSMLCWKNLCREIVKHDPSGRNMT